MYEKSKLIFIEYTGRHNVVATSIRRHDAADFLRLLELLFSIFSNLIELSVLLLISLLDFFFLFLPKILLFLFFVYFGITVHVRQ